MFGLFIDKNKKILDKILQDTKLDSKTDISENLSLYVDWVGEVLVAYKVIDVDMLEPFKVMFTSDNPSAINNNLQWFLKLEEVCPLIKEYNEYKSIKNEYKKIVTTPPFLSKIRNTTNFDFSLRPEKEIKLILSNIEEGMLSGGRTATESIMPCFSGDSQNYAKHIFIKNKGFKNSTIEEVMGYTGGDRRVVSGGLLNLVDMFLLEHPEARDYLGIKNIRTLLSKDFNTNRGVSIALTPLLYEVTEKKLSTDTSLNTKVGEILHIYNMIISCGKEETISVEEFIKFAKTRNNEDTYLEDVFNTIELAYPDFVENTNYTNSKNTLLNFNSPENKNKLIELLEDNKSLTFDSLEEKNKFYLDFIKTAISELNKSTLATAKDDVFTTSEGKAYFEELYENETNWLSKNHNRNIIKGELEKLFNYIEIDFPDYKHNDIYKNALSNLIDGWQKKDIVGLYITKNEAKNTFTTNKEPNKKLKEVVNAYCAIKGYSNHQERLQELIDLKKEDEAKYQDKMTKVLETIRHGFSEIENNQNFKLAINTLLPDFEVLKRKVEKPKKAIQHSTTYYSCYDETLDGLSDTSYSGLSDEFSDYIDNNEYLKERQATYKPEVPHIYESLKVDEVEESELLVKMDSEDYTYKSYMEASHPTLSSNEINSLVHKRYPGSILGSADAFYSRVQLINSLLSNCLEHPKTVDIGQLVRAIEEKPTLLEVKKILDLFSIAKEVKPIYGQLKYFIETEGFYKNLLLCCEPSEDDLEFLQRVVYEALCSKNKMIPYEGYFHYTGYIVRGLTVTKYEHPLITYLRKNNKDDLLQLRLALAIYKNVQTKLLEKRA